MRLSFMRSIVITGLAGGLAVSAVQAQTNTPRIDRREANQEQRIEQGKASGELNRREAARLDRRHDKLESDIAAAKSDGKVTGAERKQLRAEERRQSRAIHRQKHDGQSRP